MLKQKKYILAILVILVMFIPNYTNAASVSVGKVTSLKTTAQATSTITLSWKKVSKATGYRVYVYNSSTGKYEYYGQTKTNSITVKGLKASKEYKIKVRAYRTVSGKKYYGSYSSVLTTATTPSKVKNLTAKSQDTNSITLTWNKVTRATGYRVYIYNSSTGKYEYYGQTKTNSITIKGLKASKEYKIKVRAYKTVDGTKYYGTYSSVLTTVTKPSKVKSLTASSQTDTTVTLSWNSVIRASGYRIYVYNSSTKSYDYYGYSTTTSFTIEGLSSAKEYKVKVRAYKTLDGTRYYGSYSDVVTVATKPTKVQNLTSTSTTTSSITISWDKVTRASGYRVYVYSEYSQSYKYYKQTTSTSLTISDLDIAKFYKIKVRAYFTSDDTKYYGSYSSVLVQKTKSTSSIRAGIDVSKYQGDIDWTKVKKAGVEFVMIRIGYTGSSEGGIHEDDYFKENIEGALDAGLEVGVYFFSYAIDEDEAEEEAEWVISTLKSYGYDEEDCKYIAFDFEVFGQNRVEDVSTKQVNKNTIAFLSYVSKKDFTPILYGNKTHLTNKFDVDSIQESVSDCLIWLAQYNDETTYESSYDMWQYSSTGSISGISGDVDLNVVYFKEF